jgi:hypothetical protein
MKMDNAVPCAGCLSAVQREGRAMGDRMCVVLEKKIKKR